MKEDYKGLLGLDDHLNDRNPKWFPSDTKSNFLKSSKENQEYWNNNPFKYTLNSWGHRCENIIVSQDNIVFLGCSLTFGIGLPKEQTWTHQVAEALGKREVNLGVPGGSLDSAYRLYDAWQYEIKADVTVLMIPPGRRVEIDRGKYYLRYAHWSRGTVSDFTPEMDDFIMFSCLDDKPYQTIKNKNIAAIKWIAHETNSKLYIVESHSFQLPSPSKTIGDVRKHERTARDGRHPGPVWHEETARYILNEIRRDTETSSS